jgi:hypothetical protein
MPACGTIIARNNVTAVTCLATAIAGDDVAFWISGYCVVRWFWSPISVYLWRRVGLCSRKADLLVLTLVTRLDAFEVVSDFVRKRKRFRYDIVDLLANATEEAINNFCPLIVFLVAPGHATWTEPFAIDFLVGIQWWLQAGVVERVGTSIAAKELALTSA